MTDRLQEIRARLAIAQHYTPRDSTGMDGQLLQRLQEDVQFLLSEVDYCERRIRLLADGIITDVMFGRHRG